MAGTAENDPNPSPAVASTALDAGSLRRAMALFGDSLRQHRDEINSLNVFPVPDGDTGTNLVLTQEVVERAIAGLEEEPSLDVLGRAISRASLLGARGNSGVILSQVLRGLFERLPDDGNVTPAQLASALEHASREADRAVARPVDGTMLSVLRDASRVARSAAERATNCGTLMEAVLDAARQFLARTRDVLPELREAGVVDAGAKGLVLLFDALHASLTGRSPSEPVGPPGPVGAQAEDTSTRTPLELAFEVQYLLEAEDDRVPVLRQRLGALGDSLVVVGGGGLYNVHVHTNDPDAAVQAARDWGRPREVSIVRLEGRSTDCIGGQARAVRVAEQACALVAVAEGIGLARTFRSLGAVVVPGGPGENPSLESMLHAVESAPAGEVIVLPNHPNVRPAAERAAEASSKRARVVATGSIPAGLAAATAFNPLADLDVNLRHVDEAAAACRAGEVARAERDAQTEAGPVRTGDWLAITAGRVVAVGDGAAAVASGLARTLVNGDAELLTVVTGRDASPTEIDEVVAAIGRALPELEVEVLNGGQRRYPYLIGAE